MVLHLHLLVQHHTLQHKYFLAHKHGHHLLVFLRLIIWFLLAVVEVVVTLAVVVVVLEDFKLVHNYL